MATLEQSMRQLTVKGYPFNYRLIDNGQKETIVLLHAAFADHTLFASQIDRFRNSYRLIVLDLPGHGDNLTTGSKITMADVPAILRAIVDEHGLGACHLLGVSLGSLAAQAFAAEYPELTRSVAIVGGYSIHKDYERIVKAQRKEGIKWSFYMLASMKRFKRYVVSVSCATEEGRSLFAQAIGRFRFRSFPAMAGTSRYYRPNPAPVPYPLLIVVGEHDLPLAREAAARLHELEPHSRYALVPGAGHCANADAPDEFNRLVERFFASPD